MKTEDNCVICIKNKACAWFHGKNICSRCWYIYRYGDMEGYMERLKFDKLKKELQGGRKA